MPVFAAPVVLLRGLAALLVAALWAGCAQLGAPTKITLSETELQRLMTGKFPVEQRLLELFEVRASSPQLRLLPERNRIAAVLDLQARERIMATQYKGRLNFESALRWDAAEQAVRLDQVRVQDFVLDTPTGPGAAPPAGSVRTADAAGAARRTGAERVAAAMAERVLEGLILYRLGADKQAQLDKAGVQPAALAVTRSGLEITFEPKAK
jgi:hypothetical protein